jgi:flagellar basal-body rod protein FlgG
MSFSGVQNLYAGMKAAQDVMQHTSNNIANAESLGYKNQLSHITDGIYSTHKVFGIREADGMTKTPVSVQYGTGSKIVGVHRSLAMGKLKQTEQPLDFAISGGGYFAVTLANGRRGFTRVGLLKTDPETGTLVLSDGTVLEDGIVIPPTTNLDTVNISRDGLVTYVDGENNIQEAGRIVIYNFPNEQGLEHLGNGIVGQTDGSGEAFAIEDQTSSFMHKYLEGSNVSVIDEMTTMLSMQQLLQAVGAMIAQDIKIYDSLIKAHSG